MKLQVNLPKCSIQSSSKEILPQGKLSSKQKPIFRAKAMKHPSFLVAVGIHIRATANGMLTRNIIKSMPVKYIHQLVHLASAGGSIRASIDIIANFMRTISVPSACKVGSPLI